MRTNIYCFVNISSDIVCLPLNPAVKSIFINQMFAAPHDFTGVYIDLSTCFDVKSITGDI